MTDGVPVEQLAKGDYLTLPQSSRTVRVERVDHYEEDDTYVVRWKSGQDLGSLVPKQKGELVPDARRQHEGMNSLTGVVEPL